MGGTRQCETGFSPEEVSNMNLNWTALTQSQRAVLAGLASGPGCVTTEIGEQLVNLGLIERVRQGGAFSITALGATVMPATVH